MQVICCHLKIDIYKHIPTIGTDKTQKHSKVLALTALPFNRPIFLQENDPEHELNHIEIVLYIYIMKKEKSLVNHYLMIKPDFQIIFH